MSVRSWDSDDWAAEIRQHQADADAEARHEATHLEAVDDCGLCEAEARDAAQDAADDEGES